MSIDIDNIFKATAQDSWSFLVTNGQGCYIPAYQRPYSWGKDNVDRLFEDAIHGLNLLLKREKTISFLGTIIAIHDTKYTTVQPIFRSEMPQKVMTIIDGQQRICTFAMVNIALHNLAQQLLPRIRGNSDPSFMWLADQAAQLIAHLEDTLFLDMRTGDEEYKYYPRIVRSYDDVWSKRRGQARYDSPIARLIWEYFAHSRSETCHKIFKYEPKTSGGESDHHHASVESVFGFIKKLVRDITGAKTEEFDFPDLLNIVQSNHFVEAIWNFQIPEEVTNYIRDNQDQPAYERFAQLLRVVILARYICQRMAFTVVTAESEDDAFDMFEALNTTGEPLTAFETFKPKVIEAETMREYEHSPSFAHVEEIEQYLMHFKKAEDKQKATSEMLVPFALSETGEKLQKRLTDQRRYLREQFESDALQELDDKRRFVQRLSHVAKYMRIAWRIPGPTGATQKPSFDRAGETDDETLVGFQVLRDLNHHITIAPLSRFFSEVLEAEETDKAARAQDFFDAVRAAVGFSILWRGAFGGTNNIDSHYRAVLSEKADGTIPPLAVRPKADAGAVSLSNFRKRLKRFLEKEGIHTRDGWVKKAARIPIYDANAVVTRYLILLASHDSAPDTHMPGLIVRGRPNIAPCLTLDKWLNRDELTVEHIAPQKSAGGWDPTLYEDPDTVNVLGNLILLPGQENSVVGNKPWEQKRALYRMLSAETPEEFERYKQDCSRVGLSLGRTAEQVLDQSSYLSMCRSIGQKTDDWALDIVNERSERIAELAWEKLAPSLDL